MWASTEEEALYHARRIIEIAPDSPRGYAQLSLISWYISGRIDESIRWANKAIEIDPRQPGYKMQTAYAYATLGDIDMAMAYWERANQIVADDVSPVQLQILRALILLSDKDRMPTQQVFDVLEAVDVGSTHRMEIEANLAIINGDAKEWLDSHAEHLSECLNAPIDEAYPNKWPECNMWLDGVLQAAGDEARARAAAEKRLPWFQRWMEWGGEQVSGDPRDFVILGKEDQALDDFELRLADYRGNPYMNRLFLDESLRFMLYHDPLLSPIRDHPRFQAVVAEVEADLAQQLENVREMERRGEIPTLEELQAEIASE